MIKFKLRPWSHNDLDNLVRYGNNFQISKNMMDSFSHPYTKENGKAFITFATKDDPIHIFAIDIGGEAIGGIGIHLQTDVHKKNAELGYWLAEPFWGQGIITRAIDEMVTFGFNTYDINRIYARPFGTNTASRRVLEKAGFILEAKIEKGIFKNGEEVDELIYGIRRGKTIT